MEPLTKGNIVLIYFPFSDLSKTKLRPAVVLADVGKQDYILCQITSNPYSDSKALKLDDNDFKEGSLKRISYARPTKLFTANVELMSQTVGILKQQKLQAIIKQIIEVLSD